MERLAAVSAELGDVMLGPPGTLPTDVTARLVDPRQIETLDVLGPTIAFLTAPADGEPCVMRGTIPPRGSVPLHSHADPETFLMLAGDVEGLVMSPEGHRWVAIRPGEVFHVPGGAPHAWRNPNDVPAVMNLVSTAQIGRFFREVGTPVSTPAPPSEDVLRRFLEVSERYGYWNATPEENAGVGLAPPGDLG
jgi:quercetin dioxygenase-like cupin family protein